MAGEFEFSFSVTIDGHDVLERRFATAAKNIEDWKGLWPQVAAWFYAMEADVFASEGRGKWAPLAPSTQRQRTKRGYGAAHPILEQTGRLAASLMGGEGHVKVETATSITLGTDLQVGSYTLGLLHQRGTGRMPARPVIGTGGEKPKLTQGDTTLLRKLFSTYLHAQLTNAGLTPTAGGSGGGE